MIKSYVHSVFRIMLLSVLISQPLQAVELFDKHPIVAGSVIAAPLPIVAISCAGMYTTSAMLLEIFAMLFGVSSGKSGSDAKFFVPFAVAPIVTAVIADAVINRTFSKSDSKKKAVHAAAATNASMSLVPFLCVIATAPEECTKTINELKYPIASVGLGSLIGAAYMLYEYYKPMATTEHDKQNNKAG
jgi:hypothetical protein